MRSRNKLTIGQLNDGNDIENGNTKNGNFVNDRPAKSKSPRYVFGKQSCIVISLVASAIIISGGWFISSAFAGDGGFGYIFTQCFFKSYNTLDYYVRSEFGYPSIQVALESENRNGVAAGFFANKFPTDKDGRHNYTINYDVLLQPYFETAENVLEIGVKKGGSIKLWREVFSSDTFIYGMDIDQAAPNFVRDAHIKVIILDSNDPVAVENAFKDIQFDVIIDDGCHTFTCQYNAFQVLFPHLKDDGIYIVEDIRWFPRVKFTEDVKVVIYEDKSVESSFHEAMAVIFPPSSLARHIDIRPVDSGIYRELVGDEVYYAKGMDVTAIQRHGTLVNLYD